MKTLSEHKVEAGLFAVALSALAAGIPLIALPGTGTWSTIGWALAGLGLICFFLSGLLWGPIASRIDRLSPRHRRRLTAGRLVGDEFVLMIDEGTGLKGDAFSGPAPWRVLKTWQEQAASFLESTLGAAERQRFLDAGDAAEDRLAGLLGWLRGRRDDDSTLQPIPGVDVVRAVAVRREAWANVGVIDSPEIEVTLSPLDPLAAARSAIFELRIGNRGPSELHDVLLRVEVSDRLDLRQTTRSGEDAAGGLREESDDTRRWSDQIGPLTSDSERTLHFSILPSDAADLPVAVGVRVADRPWLVTRFSFEVAEAASPPPKAPVSKPRRRSPDGDRAALGRLYVEGRRMQKAADPLAQMTAAGILYGTPPDEAKVERWEGRVREALPRSYRRRFTFGPLDAEAGGLSLPAFTPFPESHLSRRLKASLEELQRIIEELDEAASR